MSASSNILQQYGLSIRLFFPKAKKKLNTISNNIFSIGNVKSKKNFTSKHLPIIDKSTQPNFFEKFIEIILVSFEQNNNINLNDATLPTPSEWPFLKKGIFFWASKDSDGKLFLTGNILTWISSFYSVLIFILLMIIDIVTKRRNYTLFEPKDCKFLYLKGGFFLIGYFLHYFPFFLMGRALFLHHYLPSYIFSVFVFASCYEVVSTKIIFLKSKIFVLSLIIAIFSVFAKLSPLTYGFLVGKEHIKNLKLYPEWNFI